MIHDREKEGDLPDLSSVLQADWEWDSTKDPIPSGAYLHVPFCHHRCNYCNFTVVAGRDDLIDAYLDSVFLELQGLGKPRTVQTIFLGGGTPTALSIEALRRLLLGIHRWLPLAEGGEWSIEANPKDLTDAKLRVLREHGVNRMSIGGQSFDSGKLRALDRDHTPEELQVAIERSDKWIGNVSLDLIFAAPQESISMWQSELDRVVELPLKHLSTYGLTYEKGARLWSQWQNGQVQRATEEDELAMYQATMEHLAKNGYEHYEVSNFSKQGYRSRHNEIYWTDQRWHAFGPGAARFLGRTRSTNHRSTTEYIKRISRGLSPVAEKDRLTDASLLIDRLVFGLRRLEGIEWEGIFRAYRVEASVRAQLESIRDAQVERSWLEFSNGRLKLTPQGLVVSDGLWGQYLAEA